MIKQEKDAARRIAARWLAIQHSNAGVSAEAKVVRGSQGYIVYAGVFVHDADVKMELKNETPKA